MEYIGVIKKILVLMMVYLLVLNLNVVFISGFGFLFKIVI